MAKSSWHIKLTITISYTLSKLEIVRKFPYTSTLMIRREEFDENLRVLVIPSKLIPKATRSWQNKVKDHDNDDDDDDDDDEEEEEE